MSTKQSAKKFSLGFKDASNRRLFKWLAIPWFIFCLSRLPYLNMTGFYCAQQVPGFSALLSECQHWLYNHRLGWSMFGHLACTLPAGMLAVLQFVPSIRQKYRQLHRVVGYVATTLAFGGIVTALLIMDASFGGEPETLFAALVAGPASAYALYQGIKNARAKRIAAHRVWMIRAWVSLGSILTMRFFMPLTALFVSLIPLYRQYTAIPCNSIVATFKGNVKLAHAAYPLCDPVHAALNPSGRAIVQANLASDLQIEQDAALRVTFGTSWWIAMIIHVFAVEVYLKWDQESALKAKKVKDAGIVSKSEASGVSVTDVLSPVAGSLAKVGKSPGRDIAVLQ